MNGWLKPEEFKQALNWVPIVCIDVVPLRLKDDGSLGSIGLIYRDTPHQGKRWCIVGGRLWRNELIAEAIARQIRETLGPSVAFEHAADPQPHYVWQYFPEQREVGSIDPRQHAVTLVFCVAIRGDPHPAGEAIDFRWFDPCRLPPPAEFGFGQDDVVDAALAVWRRQE